jgi:hypothetical protein
MNKIAVIIPLVFAFSLPIVASAHERQVFEINGKQYQIIIGSIGEPVVVDDKSGVEIRVSTLPSNTPVEGLQDTLRAELIAGDKKRELPFEAIYNSPGAYKAPFYPTVATTLSYRVFGDIDGTPFDVTFACQPAGHAEATEDKTRTEISQGVVRTLKTGGYGCPSPKADLGFPEQSSDLVSLKEKASGTMVPYAALGFSVLALGVALARRK